MQPQDDRLGVGSSQRSCAAPLMWHQLRLEHDRGEAAGARTLVLLRADHCRLIESALTPDDGDRIAV